MIARHGTRRGQKVQCAASLTEHDPKSHLASKFCMNRSSFSYARNQVPARSNRLNSHLSTATAAANNKLEHSLGCAPRGRSSATLPSSSRFWSSTFSWQPSGNDAFLVPAPFSHHQRRTPASELVCAPVPLCRVAAATFRFGCGTSNSNLNDLAFFLSRNWDIGGVFFFFLSNPFAADQRLAILAHPIYSCVPACQDTRRKQL
ncbi:uncharacterized protein LY79DRAFT_361822 [Colletotrichum navitas]|uniref:Uncharacterized protein n=1 Tax=Colletotrichum navitas TaxID=681940 RepID=A0AAD8V1S7_9PEZI|nr:uncharacterized protein LY79DRAFT_361822 [Colletotrichum navitas]KAK1574665.1 hypothetical protein LY79DRAFT_361822 [Colletotrichum navitas]